MPGSFGSCRNAVTCTLRIVNAIVPMLLMVSGTRMEADLMSRCTVSFCVTSWSVLNVRATVFCVSLEEVDVKLEVH